MKKLSFVKEKLKRHGRNFLSTCLLLASFAGLKAQLVSSYSFSQSSGTYTPISGGTNMVLSSTATSAWDSQFFHNSSGGINGTTTSGTYAAFPIGFNFTYNGTVYDGFYMSTDGALRLATTAASSLGSLGGSSPISATTATSINLISAFGVDLIGGIRAASLTRTNGSPTLNLTGTSTAVAGMITPGMRVVGASIPAGATVVSVSGSDVTISSNATASSTTGTATFVDVDNISYVTTGTPGSQILTVQWKNVSRFSGSGDRLNFQIKLYEGTNVIEAVYDATASTQVTTASTVQVGLKGASNADFNNRLGTGTSAWSASALGTANNSTIAFSGIAATAGEIIPPSGLTFTWTPPAICTGTPTAGTVSPTMQTLLSGQTPANLVVSGYSPGVSGLAFQWEQSSDNTNWTNAVGGSGATNFIYTPPAYAGTTIYYRCKVTCTNSAIDAFTPSVILDSCPAVTSYSNDFESTTGSELPQCWMKVGTTGSANTQASTGITGARNLYMYSTSASAIAYVMMPTVSNLQAGTHKLKFKARSNVTVGGKIEVGYFAIPGDVSSFTQVGSSYTTTSITVADNFDTGGLTLPAGVTNLVFRHNPSPSNSVLIDDVIYEQLPSCIEPTAINASGITSSGATINWTAPSIVPGSGYEYYYSTSNTAPTAGTTPSGTSVTTSASLSGLSPLTTYYVWIRSVCSGSDKSIWTTVSSFVTLCQPPAILSVNGATVCGASGSATISATADSGATITWYDAPTGGNELTTGGSYTTPVISSNTTYYVSAKSVSNPPNAGLANAISTSGYTLEAGLFFDATSSFTINGVYVYPIGTGPGTVVIALQDGSVSPAVTLQTITVNLTGTTAPYVKTYVPLNFSVTPGSNYKLMMMSRSGGVSSLVRESGTSWGAYPLSVPGVMNITNGNCCSGNTTSTSYYYFYDWQLTADCESARQPVNVVVNSSCLGTSETSALKDNIKVYPNPFTDVLNISQAENVKSISVTDLAGRLLKTIEKPSSAINLSDLKSGMYLVTFYLKDGTQKTVKSIKK